MASLVVIVVCLLVGVLLQLRRLPPEAHVALNAVILHLSLPAVCLLHVPRIDWRPELSAVVLVTWIIFGASYLFFTSVGKKLHWDRATQGCLVITAGLCNSAFVGFPVIEFLYGAEGLRYAVLLDQPGSFLIVSTAAVVVAGRFSGTSARKRDTLRQVFSFPPFLAFCASLGLGLAGIQPDGVAEDVLRRVAGTLPPLAMVSVGLQLRIRELRNELAPLVLGLLFKLFLAPLLIFVSYRLLELPSLVFDVVVLESAMAPMITGGIVAAAYNLRPRLSGLMIGVGVPLSFLTLSAWYLCLN